jgi:hypothetical protein
MPLLAAMLLVGCGGSGSTGLISPENALLEDVRREDSCVTIEEGLTYCATSAPEAVAPNGASALGPFPSGDGGAPTATPTPSGPQATPLDMATSTPAAGAPTLSPTPAPGETVPRPEPTPCVPAVSGACPDGIFLAFDVFGFPAGAACALAARAPDDQAPWATAALVPAGGVQTSLVLPLPEVEDAAIVEIALLCYETAPVDLPDEVVTLAEAGPDVVFVPDAPVEVR